MALTHGQQNAENAILTGHNVFLTGNGGTGKSYVAQDVIEKLKAEKKKVVICAPTGIAAQVLGGVTIHSAFKFDLSPKVASELYGVHPSSTIRAADVLVIDEVGMVRRDLMDAVAKVIVDVNAGRRRRGDKPLQVVTLGDFGQIPPIVTREDEHVLSQAYGRGFSPYAFASDGWKRLGLEPIVLTETVRQTNDDFIKALDEARLGDPSCLPYLNRLAERGEAPDDAIAIIGTNRQVDAINDRRLAELDAEEETFHGTSIGTFKKNEMMAPETLRLKRGARVMITANNPTQHYMNGSTGVVVDMEDADDPTDDDTSICVLLDDGRYVYVHPFEWTKYKYDVVGTGRDAVLNKEKVGSYTQYPLRLAWAVTYHKSQGQTFDKVSIDPWTFNPGMLYVGLSRARTPDGVWLTRKMTTRDLNADRSVIDFYKSLPTTQKKYEPPKPPKPKPEPEPVPQLSLSDIGKDDKTDVPDIDVDSLMYPVATRTDMSRIAKNVRQIGVTITQDHVRGDKARKMLIDAVFGMAPQSPENESWEEKTRWFADGLEELTKGE